MIRQSRLNCTYIAGSGCRRGPYLWRNVTLYLHERCCRELILPKGWTGKARGDRRNGSGLDEEDFVLFEEVDQHVVPELVKAFVEGEDGEGTAGGAQEAFAVKFAV